jgi:hypothetical protein
VDVHPLAGQGLAHGCFVRWLGGWGGEKDGQEVVSVGLGEKDTWRYGRGGEPAAYKLLGEWEVGPIAECVRPRVNVAGGGSR